MNLGSAGMIDGLCKIFMDVRLVVTPWERNWDSALRYNEQLPVIIRIAKAAIVYVSVMGGVHIAVLS